MARSLTKKGVGRLRAPKAGRAYYRDGEVKGLMVRVTPAGARSYVLAYRFNGRARLKTLGRAEDVSLADARDQARELRRAVQAGRDPEAPAPAAPLAAGTLADVVQQYVDAPREEELSPTTRKEYARMLRAYVLPSDRGAVKLADLGRADVKALLEGVKASSGRVMANRVHQLVRAALRWAADPEGGNLIAENPAHGLKRPGGKERSRERVLADAEVKALLAAASKARPAAAAAVRVLLLLGQRTGETLAMRWRHLDGNVWTIPGATRKGGETHVVPIPAAVLRVIRALPRSGERVFSGVSEANAERDWWGTIREATLAELDGAERFSRHDLRRTCATGCARMGAAPMTISRILGHSAKGYVGGAAVSAVYDRYSGLPEILAALERWAAHVARVEAGETSNVVRLA